MQKKLLAVAVAGALAAPALAWAQTSTVNIYGRITYEYGIADQGRGRPNVDYADSPGGSAIGFRGEEKLGGGISAWFQCESSADVRAFDQTGWCTRNSAVGFRGAFGNLHFGRWDTPLKRAMNQGTVGAEETGILGMSFMAFGGSGGAQAAVAGNNPLDLGIETQQRQRFKRREAGLSYYETPVFGGFQGLFAFSPGNAQADYPGVDGQTNDDPRVWSVGAVYNAGPIALGAGYEKHVQFGTTCLPAPPPPASVGIGTFTGSPCSLGNFDDTGWGLSAAYTFAGRVKIGGTFLKREWETAPGRELSKKTYTAGVEWAVAGPHGIEAQFTYADDSEGNSLSGIGGNGGASAPRAIVGGVERPVGATGGKAYSLAYTYAFSKRTRVKLGYVRVDNDANTASSRIGNTAGLTSGGSPNANGQTLDGWAFHIGHRF